MLNLLFSFRDHYFEGFLNKSEYKFCVILSKIIYSLLGFNTYNMSLSSGHIIVNLDLDFYYLKLINTVEIYPDIKTSNHVMLHAYKETLINLR